MEGLFRVLVLVFSLGLAVYGRPTRFDHIVSNGMVVPSNGLVNHYTVQCSENGAKIMMDELIFKSPMLEAIATKGTTEIIIPSHGCNQETLNMVPIHHD